MGAYSTQIVELLALRRTPDGSRRIQVGVVHEDRQASYMMDIDEFTFSALEALHPLNGARVRLSPYPRWDPYRNEYYSAMIRTTGVSRDTLYFACSEAYVGLMHRLRQGEVPSAPDEDAGRAAAEEREGEIAPRKSRLAAIREGRGLRQKAPQLAARLLLAGGLLAVLAIPSAGLGWSDRAEALSGHAAAVQLEGATGEGDAEAVASAVEPAEQVDAADAPDAGAGVGAGVGPAAVIAEASAQTADAAVQLADARATRVEVMNIGEGKEFFQLPKTHVALTFDDGPSALTKQIVDILTEEQVKGTFLFVGKNAERLPDAVAYASDHGMSVGNHSWDHSVLTKAAAANQRKNLEKASRVLEAAMHKPVTVFRPPYGAVNSTLLDSAKAEHMNTLLWNRDPEDWNAKKPEDILQYFRSVDSSGGVYVLHEDKNTLAALPDIIRYLKEKDLTFVAFE